VTNIEAYNNDTLTFNAGVPGRFAIPLVYSGGVQQLFTGLDVAQDILQGRHAVPNLERGLIIRAVHWWCRVEPNTWVLGNRMMAGMRLIAAEMDPSDTSADLMVNYTMWAGSTGALSPAFQAAFFADEQFLTEQRRSKSFGDASTTPELILSGRWRGRRRLQPEEGLFAFFEAPAASVNMRQNLTYFRTLVELPM